MLDTIKNGFISGYNGAKSAASALWNNPKKSIAGGILLLNVLGHDSIREPLIETPASYIYHPIDKMIVSPAINVGSYGFGVVSDTLGSVKEMTDIIAGPKIEEIDETKNLNELRTSPSIWMIKKVKPIPRRIIGKKRDFGFIADEETKEVLYEALVWSRMAKNQLPRSHLEELTDKVNLYWAERDGRSPATLFWYNSGSIPTQKEKKERHEEWAPYMAKLDDFLMAAGVLGNIKEGAELFSTDPNQNIYQIPKEIAESAKNKARLYWCKSPTGPEELKEDICP